MPTLNRKHCPKHGTYTTKRCMKCKAATEKSYDKHHRNKESNKVYQSKEWREVREQAIIRDGFACVECGTPIGITPKDHAVDHIVELTDGGAKYDLDNLQTLCIGCHNKKTKGTSDVIPENI